MLAATSETVRTVLEWGALPAGWTRLLALAALGGLCALVLWFYRWERRAGAGPVLRTVLAAVRCLVMVGLAVIWLEPVRATYLLRSVSARVAVLLDASASMSASDPNEEGGTEQSPAESRWNRIQHLVERDDFRWLRRLQENNELSLYAIGDETTRLALPWESVRTTSAPGDLPESTSRVAATQSAGAGELADVRPTAPRTDFGQALAKVIDEAGESPIAGVILVSDGAVNHGISPDEVAALAARSRAPVYSVGVGSPHEPPNVRITGMTAPTMTAAGDPFTLRVEVAGTGLESTDVDVGLTVAPTAGGVVTEVAKRHVRVGEGITTPALMFEITAPGPGEYSYVASVPPLPGEAVTQDNARSVTVTVPEDRVRVLLVAGGPSFEYQYLTRLLERDHSVDLSCWLQSADERAVRDGTTVIRQLPREPADLFAYDAILLFDPDPTDLDPSWAITVRRWVDELGGGVLFQAGPHFSTRFLRDPRMQELVAILPVTPDPDADMRISAAGTYRLDAVPIRVAETARAQPLIALNPDPTANLDVWRALPGAWWYLPVLRSKPVATVLLETNATAPAASAAPLMVVQPFGAGRTAFMAFNTTWRWRATAEPCFNRFWIQTVRYLAYTRREQLSRRGTLTLDRDTFGVGDYVRIEAHVLDSTYAPYHESEVRATVEWPDEKAQEAVLTAIPQRDGWFAGRVLLEHEGPAVVRVPLPGPSDAGAPAEMLVRRILVERPDVEMQALRLREDVLTTLSQKTGGEYFRLADANALPDRIHAARERKPPQRTAAEPLWDNAWVMGALAALLALEWTLRRRSHLL